MRHFNKSQQYFEDACLTLAGGVSSTLRTAMKPVPLYLEKGMGARVWDVDGNEYVDYIMGYGPLILGHSHQELLEFVFKAVSDGQQFGMQHAGEVELSRKIVELVPSADKVAFSGSGTEAVMLALRLARAFTGRQKIVRFEGHYHGWSDAIFTSFPAPGMSNKSSSLAGTGGQSSNALQDIILLPWNDSDKLEETLMKHANEIAAVITEPIMCNSGCIAPDTEFLGKLRSITTQKGIVLIFDEVITGFRVSSSGAQGKLKVYPDLTIMGKAVAGGFPLSVVAGKREIMDLISEGNVSHLGTLNGNVLSMSAGLATLTILNRDNGAAYSHMEHISGQLINGLNQIMADKGIPHLINRFGPVFHVMFTNLEKVSNFDDFNQRDSGLYARFAQLALQAGLVVRPNGLWYTSTSHTDQDVEDTLDIVNNVLDQL